MAAQNNSTIAYLGDYDSGATAISLPLINDAGILQISPASRYVGLTSAQYAGQDEPDRFYPDGKPHVRTHRSQRPGTGRGRRRADAPPRRAQRVRRRDLDPFSASLAEIVAADAKQAGITVAAATDST